MSNSKRRTPLRAIRATCMDCCNGSPKEVKLCHLTDCPSWQYRLGKRPGSLNSQDRKWLDVNYVKQQQVVSLIAEEIDPDLAVRCVYGENAKSAALAAVFSGNGPEGESVAPSTKSEKLARSREDLKEDAGRPKSTGAKSNEE